MNPIRRSRWQRVTERRASVSVEFALVSVFFLLPLLLLCWDGMFVFAERYQINTDLHDLYYFAWSNPSEATATASVTNFLTALNSNAIAPVNLPSGFQPSLSYDCLQSDGSTSPATQSAANSGTQLESCSTGTLETMATYQLTAIVNLPVPMPGFSGPVILNVGGTIRIE